MESEVPEGMYISEREKWREWLRQNHKSGKSVWLIYYKKHTDKPSISYEDSVEEALCFGWIDSIIKRIDNERFARKFTPRKSRSYWSEANKERARKMIKEQKMTEAGLRMIKEAKDLGMWSKTPSSTNYKRRLIVPPYLMEKLASNELALKNFMKLGDSYKKNLVGWIDSAKKEDTRRRRLAESIKLLEQNKKLGLK